MKYYITYIIDEEWKIMVNTYEEVEKFMINTYKEIEAGILTGIYFIDNSPVPYLSTFIKFQAEQKKLEAERYNRFVEKISLRNKAINESEDIF